MRWYCSASNNMSTWVRQGPQLTTNASKWCPVSHQFGLLLWTYSEICQRTHKGNPEKYMDRLDHSQNPEKNRTTMYIPCSDREAFWWCWFEGHSNRIRTHRIWIYHWRSWRKALQQAITMYKIMTEALLQLHWDTSGRWLTNKNPAHTEQQHLIDIIKEIQGNFTRERVQEMLTLPVLEDISDLYNQFCQTDSGPMATNWFHTLKC